MLKQFSTLLPCQLKMMLQLLLGLWLSLGLIPAASALVVLQYHHVATTTPPATSVSPERFAMHLQQIADAGFTVISLQTFVDAMANASPLPDKAVLISFDDSYSSIYTTAFPLLKKRGWPFVVFVNTAPIDQQLAGFLSWQQLREMVASGAAIANHSVNHPHMVRRLEKENLSQWRTRMGAEIAQAQARINAETGQNHRVFAYPYGEYSADLQQLLATLKYLAFGQHSGAVSADQPLALARFPFGGEFGSEEDFALKLAALPLPFTSLRVESESRRVLAVDVLPQTVVRPVLRWKINDQTVAHQLQCYVTRQGLANKIIAEDGSLEFQAVKPLAAGRSRYNCTAAAGEGRYYWHSVAFIRKRDDGEWAAEH